MAAWRDAMQPCPGALVCAAYAVSRHTIKTYANISHGLSHFAGVSH